ncbi:hypothetical protein B0H16DRAFT_1693433 [Mycena metata]|uniref:Cyclin N-terminal domain-containing protein n=1 Tax=Mycena metata TaxID=1033252 RepID=A0AAD7IKE9_9AGAR|nr:hypothetical protein B0H16DRAFT_1693433 [Mycena metata]
MSASAHNSKTVSFSSVPTSPLLMELLNLKIDGNVISKSYYVVHCVSETVDQGLGRISTPSSCNGGFTSFVSTVLARSRENLAAVLTSLCYISRVRSNLCIPRNEYAFERVFLGALIVASKYINDRTLKNAHWAMCTCVFSTYDIGKMEREFLMVLDWELGVSEADLLAHHAGLISPTPSTLSSSPVPTLQTCPLSHVDAPSSKTAPQPKPPQIVHPALTHSQHASPFTGIVFMPELDPSGVHSPSSEMSMSPRTPRSTSPSRSRLPSSCRAPRHHPFSPRACTPDTSSHGIEVVPMDVDVYSGSPVYADLAPRGRSRYRGFRFTT